MRYTILRSCVLILCEDALYESKLTFIPCKSFVSILNVSQTCVYMCLMILALVFHVKVSKKKVKKRLFLNETLLISTIKGKNGLRLV